MAWWLKVNDSCRKQTEAGQRAPECSEVIGCDEPLKAWIALKTKSVDFQRLEEVFAALLPTWTDMSGCPYFEKRHLYVQAAAPLRDVGTVLKKWKIPVTQCLCLLTL